MKRLGAYINFNVFRGMFVMLAMLSLVLQPAQSAFATATIQNLALAVSTKAELNRREAIMTQNSKSINRVDPNASGSAVLSLVDAVNDAAAYNMQRLSNASTSAEVKSIATDVDDDYAEFRAVDLAAKLYIDLKTQDKSIKELRNLAKQIQETVKAAKANGATHVNAGVAGFVLLDLILSNVDKLDKSLKAGALTSVALSSAISLMTPLGGTLDAVSNGASAAALTQLYEQLSAVHDTLNNSALGLSQLSNVVTGNRTGVSYCGFLSNCSGNENDGAVQVCGTLASCTNNKNLGEKQYCGIIANCDNNTNSGGVQSCGAVANCQNNTNSGDVQTCGIISNCTNNSNSGGVQTCGVVANCQNNNNTGDVQTCGIIANCVNNTNTGVVQNCGVGSYCANNTNNGLFVNCGALAVCAGNTNEGISQDCGIASRCVDNTNRGLFQDCGILSNCQNYSNNGIIQKCGVLSNCVNNENNGVATICGIISDCANVKNNGGVIQCGTGSTCRGATNNGLLMVCGILSNCTNSRTQGFVSVCGDDFTCETSTPSPFVLICGTASNCSNNVINECQVNSDLRSHTSDGVNKLPLVFQEA